MTRLSKHRSYWLFLTRLSLGFVALGWMPADIEIAAAAAIATPSQTTLPAQSIASIVIADVETPIGKEEKTISGVDAALAATRQRTNPATTPDAPRAEHDERPPRKNGDLYDGTWRMTSPGNSCGIGLSSRIEISNGVIRGPGGQGHVSADGSISGHWSFVGLINASLVGRMHSMSSGGGTWRNNFGCSGYWTISR